MAEILQNTGAKLWSLVDDHDELQSNVFDQLFGTGGKSDIRLIDEAIGKINKNLNGYYFKIINDKLYICKDSESGTTSLPIAIIDSTLSLTSDNAIQNKVVTEKFNSVEAKVTANETTIQSHKNDQNNPHNVTKSQLNLGNVEDKSSETIRSEITKENVTTALGYTPYTPNEVDNKFSTLETNIDWKEAVNTFADIATTYPSPEDGWTVNTKDTDYTYRYNGTEWVAISANAIPKATNSVDGLLSKEDHAKYDDAVSKAHTHSNQSVLDGITSDKVTAWDTVNNKVDKVDGKGLSTEDYTTEEKNKLDGIAEGATANTGTITKVQANGTDVASSGTANIPAASTSAYGVTKLSSDTNSTSTELAATASAVKSAYDRATNAASLIFSNVSVATSAWASDTTYTDYPYKATITCSGVTVDHVPTVNFSLTDATSGIFAPIALSAANAVTIYASEKPTSTITIQSIVCVKGV